MTIVLDASAIIAIVTFNSTIDVHLASATKILAPDLALAEVLNVRWKYRRAKLTAPSLDAIMAFFDRISLVKSLELAIDADRLSMELDHPAYDCLYAALAEREHGRFLTADRRFARKLSKTKIDVVVFSS